MWDLPRRGIQSASPALAGGCWTTGRLEKLHCCYFFLSLSFHSCFRLAGFGETYVSTASFFLGLLAAVLHTFPVSISDTFPPGGGWGGQCSVSYLFAILYSSWGSQSKNTRVVYHPCPTVDQNSSLWPICLGWPCTKWLMALLSYGSPFTTQGSDLWRGYSLVDNHSCSVFWQQLESGHKYLDLGELWLFVTCIQGACSLQWALAGYVISALFCLSCHPAAFQVHPAFHVLRTLPEVSGVVWDCLVFPVPVNTFFLVSCLLEWHDLHDAKDAPFFKSVGTHQWLWLWKISDKELVCRALGNSAPAARPLLLGFQLQSSTPPNPGRTPQTLCFVNIISALSSVNTLHFCCICVCVLSW